MAMSINSKMIRDGAAVYYSPGWMRMIESHMAYLRQQSAGNVVSITPHQAYKYEADLFGLLHVLRVQSEYHWIVMRLNDMTSPNQLTSQHTSLILPDFAQIEKLLNVYQTTSKKIN